MSLTVDMETSSVRISASILSMPFLKPLVFQNEAYGFYWNANMTTVSIK